MDTNDTERQHGITMDINEKSFYTKNKNITILDSPGHRDFSK
jgi:translation elongation factor EF-1alpha